jgi:2-isopropylmalate synthase
MLRCSEEAVKFAVDHGLPVMYVTEDTTRAQPETIKKLYSSAIYWGAKAIVVCDTVGHATPPGVENLIRFVKEEIVAKSGEQIRIDWHGHMDRGLGVINSIAAIDAGVDQVHGCALGIGERVGNAPMELILLNMKLLGLLEDQDLTKLKEYCDTVAKAVGWTIPWNYPVVGRDAFRTATGVHAAAIIKALQKGDAWLADRVYSGVPAGWFGRKQEICIGFMSGASNVNYYLRERGIEPDETLVAELLKAGKASDHILTEEEVMSVVKRVRG